jgi:hypothetical protein
MMYEFAANGGRVIWSGPPPVLTIEGGDALAPWKQLTGVEYTPGFDEGAIAPGKVVSFDGALGATAPQTILTDFLVDRIYPVTPAEGTSPVARVGSDVVGTHRATPSNGSVTFLGFRPRDDQAASLGYEMRTWFSVLEALGAYVPTGKFGDANDNTEFVSRNSPYLACRFPNGTTAIAPHLKDTLEDWPGGFARKEEEDRAYLERVPPPSDKIELNDFRVNGHTVTYAGAGAVAFRTDADGRLIAFAGNQCAQIAIDGSLTVFASQPVGAICWAPLSGERRVEKGAVLVVLAGGTAEVRIPAPELTGKVKLYTQGATPGSLGAEVPCAIENGLIVFSATPEVAHRWLYAVME